jgi:hypothetical protein
MEKQELELLNFGKPLFSLGTACLTDKELF